MHTSELVERDSDPTINLSCSLDRGIILHGDGLGKDNNPGVYVSSGMTGLPSSPTAILMSMVARIDATANYIDSFAMNLPGQIRLPNPKAIVDGSSCGMTSIP